METKLQALLLILLLGISIASSQLVFPGVVVSAGGGGGRTNFSDDFNTDPASRWTALIGTWTWASNQVGKLGNFSYAYNTTTGSATQYAKAINRNGQTGNTFGLVLRSTKVATDGWYGASHVNGVVYFSRSNNTGWLADMASGSLAIGNGDVMACTITGTGTGTTLRCWKNPANSTPHDVANWDSASDAPDLTLTASGGTYYDTGQYVGLGVSDASDHYYDDFFGGSTQ